MPAAIHNGISAEQYCRPIELQIRNKAAKITANIISEMIIPKILLPILFQIKKGSNNKNRK